MQKQTLDFFSGFPVLLSPNAPAKLKKARLDGRTSDVYKDRRGNLVEVSGLTRDYHLYILASRISATFGTYAEWNEQTLTVSTSLLFQTSPTPTEVPVVLVFDGASPYKIPAQLRPRDVKSVSVEPPEHGGLPLGMSFTHKDGSCVGYMLSPDLLHFVRFPEGHHEITDFKVEYVGIACGPDGNRNIFQRAQAHEKVVEIQGDFQHRFGNRSLFIFAYDPGFLIQAQAQNGMVVTGPNLIPRLVDGGMNSLFEAMEASLIAYFQPEYNVEFKDFPDRRPHWLRGGFQSFDGPVLNVNRITVTLASDSSFNPDGVWSFGRFRSPTRAAKGLHYIEFDVARKG